METYISLKDAFEILRKKYERDYMAYENVKVEYGKDDRSYTSHGWGGESCVCTYSELYGRITYERKVGELVIGYEIKKNYKELQQDLEQELKDYYSTDEITIESAKIDPDIYSKKINYEKKVKINVTEKAKRLIK